MDLICILCREIERQRRSGVSYLTSSVTFYLESHFAEEISIADTARKLGVTESALIQRFREEKGITPVAYLREVRLSRAADLLTGTRKTVQEIAAEVGIPDANYFTKLFRRMYALTPSAYRKTARFPGGV